MDDFSSAIQDLPFTGLVPVALLIIVGVVLWAAGRRVLRAAFAAVGLVVGAGCGVVIAQTISLGLPSWAIALVVGLVVACVAALVFRLAVAVALAMVVAVGAPAAVLTLDELQAGPGGGTGAEPTEAAASTPATEAVEPGPRVDAASEWLFRSPEIDPASSPEAPPPEAGRPLDLEEAARVQIEQVQGLARRLLAAFNAWWDGTPERLRPAIMGATVTGGLAGLLLGTLAPSLSASVISSFGGSLLWLTSVRVLLARVGDPLSVLLPASTTSALVFWLIVALIGMAIQWTIRPKPADKSG